MGRVNWQAGCRRRARRLAILCWAALGSLPALATADPTLLPVSNRFLLDPSWSLSRDAAFLAPAAATEPPRFLRLHDVRDLLRPAESPLSGLQLFVDPDAEEVFVGWQFDF